MDTEFIGNKLPVEYFYTKGKGESNYGGKGDPYEAGSYDAALTHARIEQSNIVFYTSLIPPIAEEITRKDALKKIKFGNVMDSIMSIMNGKKGQTITAALSVTKVMYNNKLIGYMACEYSGYDTPAIAQNILLHDVDEMIFRRKYGNPKYKTILYKENTTDKGYIFKVIKFYCQTMKINKNYGTVLSAICFTKYKLTK